MGAEWQENDWVVSVFRRLKKKKKRIQPVGVIFIFFYFLSHSDCTVTFQNNRNNEQQ